MSRDDHQMKIRLPAELKDSIESAASANKRSLNAEIVHRLQATFDVDLEKLGKKLEYTEFDAAAGRINALGLAMVLKNISDALAPSFKESDEPFAKTVLSAQKLAAQAAKTLLETSDKDAEVMKRTIESFEARENKKASD